MDDLIKRLHAVYEERERETKRRGYLGASLIGHECERYLWLWYRWVARPGHPGRILRLFERGHREEPWLVRDLREAGLEVIDRDEATGEQFRFDALGGQLSGGIDGVCRGVPGAERTWHLLEIKTASRKAWARLEKEGPPPRHVAQMQVYMRLAGLTRALYVSVCKDDDHIYATTISLNRALADGMIERAERIVRAHELPLRLAVYPDAPPCSWCEFRPQCSGEVLSDVTCRSCAHATPLTEGEGGRWQCERHGHLLSHEEQESACDDHVYLPTMIEHSECVGAGEEGRVPDSVIYQHRETGVRWANVGAQGFVAEDMPSYGSRELRTMPGAAIGDEAVEAAREVFGGDHGEGGQGGESAR